MNVQYNESNKPQAHLIRVFLSSLVVRRVSLSDSFHIQLVMCSPAAPPFKTCVLLCVTWMSEVTSSDSFAMQNSCLAARKLNNKGEDMMAVAASTAGDSEPTSQKHRSRLSFRRKEPPQIGTIPNSGSRWIWRQLEEGAFLHDLVWMVLLRLLFSKLHNL